MSERGEDSTTGTLSADERAAMKERAAELRAQAKRAKSADKAAADRKDCEDAIAKMEDGDRKIAERVHAIVGEVAPDLAPRTYYGMPAWAKDGKVLCFFQASAKFTVRYCTLGFEQPANLDDGDMWPTAWAITKLSKADERRIADLVRQANT